jgi:glycosyltransferase involved in cell wall biosynthesis
VFLRGTSAESTNYDNARNDHSTPAVTIIIPAYKAAAYVSEAVDSVFAQTFTNYELIVINDGSPDTPQLEQALEPYQDRLKYIEHENRGAAAARNTGLHAARGEFVAFLDADDCWLPNYLFEQMDFINNSGADLVYSDALLTGDSPLAGQTYMRAAPSRGEVTPESLLAFECNVITSGVVARRQAIMDVGLFDERIKRAHDFDLWLRLAKYGAKLSYQRKVLLHHRILDSGLSGDTDSQIMRELNILDTIRKRGDLTPGEEATLSATARRVRAQLALESGKTQLLDKDFAGALESFKESNKLQRSWRLILVCLCLRTAPGLLWRVYRLRSTS